MGKMKLPALEQKNLGMEVMHECNAHNFPLDLTVIEAPSTNSPNNVVYKQAP